MLHLELSKSCRNEFVLNYDAVSEGIRLMAKLYYNNLLMLQCVTKRIYLFLWIVKITMAN
jgi:hypothetical protein